MQDVEVKGSVRVALGLADSRVAILAIVGTRSINVEVAADPGTGRDSPFRAFSFLSRERKVPTTPLRTLETPYF